jgi:Tfp pilus assembly protein PilV
MAALKQLAGTAIGKAIMWLCAVLVIAVAVLGIWVYVLYADMRVEKAERDGIEYALSVQSQMIDANRVDYENNLKIAQDKNNRVEIKYRDRVMAIYQWKEGENNVTCDDLVDALDSYQY